MKRFIIILLILEVIFGIGCYEEDQSDVLQSQQTEQALAEAQRQIGMPVVKTFQQRKLMKMVYEQCDREDLICYAYIKSDYNGSLTYIGKCMGYGIPFSAQYTNPMKHKGYTNEGYTIPQADPNGLFMPTSSSATWLLMIDPKTKKPRPVYIEPEIVVSPFRLN